ncbi:GPI-anchored protein LLG3 [Silene latifolia]|uniref:GPI-anchored protein LLG3 n=1 Tax=Silene latifolia TaxID=37657 RepID=UPI003D787C51
MMMNNYMGFIIFFLFIGLASSTYISDDVFVSHKSNGRSLLQAKKPCPVNFENQNYTILTSQCKGPRYSAESCCKAFKEFACPFAENISDQSTNCADTMFSYINLFGSYPPGTFASLCKEGKNGLECTEDGSPNADPKSKKNSASTNIARSPIAVLLVSSLIYLLQLL